MNYFSFSEKVQQGSTTINSKQFKIVLKTRLRLVSYKVLTCSNVSKDTKHFDFLNCYLP